MREKQKLGLPCTLVIMESQARMKLRNWGLISVGIIEIFRLTCPAHYDVHLV